MDKNPTDWFLHKVQNSKKTNQIFIYVNGPYNNKKKN